MDWKLEVVVVPVSDVDRAKEFYLGQARVPSRCRHPAHTGHAGGAHDAVRVGLLGRDRPRTDQRGRPWGGRGASFQLVVRDIGAARAELTGRGVEVSEIQQLDARDGGKFVFFADPDGNQWAVQEIRERVGAPLD